MKSIAKIISDQLLPFVRMPAQYVGIEINARKIDVNQAEVTVALAFPDTYTIGISHLGSQVLYQYLNDIPGVACDRTYCPSIDAEKVIREAKGSGLELFGLGSRCAIGEFDIVGFSLPYEMCITNVLTMLDLAGITFVASERGEDEPIIVGGDAGADGPEPIAAFFDVFIPGDGEKPFADLAEVVRRAKHENLTREQVLLEIAQTVPSAYVPRFYHPSYNPDGTLADFSPTRDDVPKTIIRAVMDQLSDSPTIDAPMVPLASGVHERVVVEVMRGCPNTCRFCQAAATRLPVRYRSVDEILSTIRKSLAATGYREVSLLSLSTSDYPHLDELIERFNTEFSPQGVSLSLPSLRVDSQLKQLPKLISVVRKAGLTIAAEAGSERLRRAIGKNITEQNMLDGVRAAYEAGWRRVKVYFMAGLPGETPADIDAIFDLCKRLSDVRKEVDRQPGAINASVSWAVPKPHSPMQWAPMQNQEYFWSVRNRLISLSNRSCVNFKFHRIERSALEGFLCRGDRKVSKVIELAWRNGARMDSWDEHFNYDAWQDACTQTSIDPDFYATRQIGLDELLPWSHIICRRSVDILKREYTSMVSDDNDQSTMNNDQ